MVKLTRQHIEFLLKNEDRLPLDRLAYLFNCTAEEVYQVYDRLTKKDEYKLYVDEKVKKMTGRRHEHGKMERTCESGEDEEETY